MSFTVEQKSLLAKLMATENVTVQHQKIQTARFDPKNRVLYLPIWQNMNGFMYDHLTGHEVGHALYTPAEGWHDAVADKSKGTHYKNFLNVIEDCRIEKKIKRKYPGLNSSFRQGFAELMKRNFFGIENKNVNELCFIDRLNIYSKSQWTDNSIKFTDAELTLIDKVHQCESWEDVVRVTDEIYDYSKDEQSQIEQQNYDFSDDYDNSEYDEYEENDQKSDEPDSDSETEDSKNQTDSQESDEESDDTDQEPTDVDDQSNVQEDYFDSIDEPRCETDEKFRQNENTLLDETCKEYVYLNIPKANLDDIVVPAKRVHESLTKHFSQYENGPIQNLVNDFKNKNTRYVDLLVKEFEMRKAAKSFSKNKLSDTGDIDINKLSSFKFDDNIFRKVMLTTKGKKHGLILLLDCSGSMQNNMAGSIEQILILSMFCRKVNIPFSVYGFNDSVNVHILDMGVQFSDKASCLEIANRKCFSANINEIALDRVYLREYLNSSMNNAEFSKCLRNMIVLRETYNNKYHDYRYYTAPRTEQLNRTPLTAAIFAVGQLMPQFRKKHNIDLSSLIIVHDGDADGISKYNKMNPDDDTISIGSISTYSQNVILCDSKNKFQYKLKSESECGSVCPVNVAALNWFRKTTHSKIFGFFLIQNLRTAKNEIYSRYVFEDGNRINKETASKASEIIEKIKADKFVRSYNWEYENYFLIIAGDSLKVQDDELQIEGKVTNGKLKSAFMKMNKRKQVSRVFVSQFVQGIAA